MITEVFTVATQRTPGLARLQASLSRFGVPITILGLNEPQFWGLGWKWKTFVRAAKGSAADTVIFCDGYDTVCLDSLPNTSAKFAAMQHPIVFSYEPRIHPEPWMSLNSGLVMADREALLGLFTDDILNSLIPDHFNDEHQIRTLYSWKIEAFKLDAQGVLFHTLGPRAPDLIAQNNRLVNPDTGESPSFVHGAYNWDLSKVEQWLAAQN